MFNRYLVPSEALSLPTQNIRVEKGAVPTTRRNLTLDDLLVHLQHYSPTTRKGKCNSLTLQLGHLVADIC